MSISISEIRLLEQRVAKAERMQKIAQDQSETIANSYAEKCQSMTKLAVRLAEVESALKGLVEYPDSKVAWAAAFKIFPPVGKAKS